MFLHIFLIPDSLILLKYWAPLIRIQEIKWPRPSEREEEKEKIMVVRSAKKRKERKGNQGSIKSILTLDSLLCESS